MERWYQAAVYHPFFRGHAHLDSKRREPYLFGESTRDILREALRQRYRLLPYWYTLFFQAHLDGIPPMRPLWLEYPQDPATFGMEDEFLLGSDLLVKPVVTPKTYRTSVYFPGAGQVWYDVHSWERIAPGAAHLPHGHLVADVACPAERIPVYQRGGSVVPRKDRPRRSSTQMANDPYTLVVALDTLGQSATGELVLDDGHSEDTLRLRQFQRRVFSFKEGTTLSCRAHPESPAYETLKHQSVEGVERVIILGLKNVPKKAVVSFEGQDVDLVVYAGENGSVYVKKPAVPVAKDWDLKLIF
jgi:alpha 1,3-glucosidase